MIPLAQIKRGTDYITITLNKDNVWLFVSWLWATRLVRYTTKEISLLNPKINVVNNNNYNYNLFINSTY